MPNIDAGTSEASLDAPLICTWYRPRVKLEEPIDLEDPTATESKSC